MASLPSPSGCNLGPNSKHWSVTRSGILTLLSHICDGRGSPSSDPARLIQCSASVGSKILCERFNVRGFLLIRHFHLFEYEVSWWNSSSQWVLKKWTWPISKDYRFFCIARNKCVRVVADADLNHTLRANPNTMRVYSVRPNGVFKSAFHIIERAFRSFSLSKYR